MGGLPSPPKNGSEKGAFAQSEAGCFFWCGVGGLPSPPKNGSEKGAFAQSEAGCFFWCGVGGLPSPPKNGSEKGAFAQSSLPLVSLGGGTPTLFPEQGLEILKFKVK